MAAVTVNSETGTPRRSPLPALSVHANFRWMLAGNVVNALSQWATLLVLARLGNEAIVGQFVLGLAIAAPVMAITMLQLRHIQVTDARREYEFGDYFGARIAWTILGLAVIAIWAWLGGYDGQTAWVIILVGLTKCIDGISDIVRGLFQRHERMDFSGMSMMLRGIGSLIALALVMWWTHDIVAAVVAMALIWLASFVAYDAVQAVRLLARRHVPDGPHRHFRPKFTRDGLVRLSWLALPLGVVMALISLQTNLPRYILDGYAGKEALGYFGAMAYPIMAGMMVLGAMGQAMSPRLAQHFVDDLDAYRQQLRRLLLLGLALGIALIAGTYLLGRPFLALYGAEYTQYAREFVVLAIAAAIQMIGSCFGYALTAARVFRTQVVLTVASCLATAVAAFALIPHWGVMGAALPVLATGLVSAILFAVTTQWAMKRQARTLAGRAPN